VRTHNTSKGTYRHAIVPMSLQDNPCCGVVSTKMAEGHAQPHRAEDRIPLAVELARKPIYRVYVTNESSNSLPAILLLWGGTVTHPSYDISDMALGVTSSEVELRIALKDLKNADFLSKSDGFAVVYVKSDLRQAEGVGRSGIYALLRNTARRVAHSRMFVTVRRGWSDRSCEGQSGTWRVMFV
jgi:hypothetical protein